MTINWSRVKELRDEVGADDFDEVADLFLDEVAETLTRLSSSADARLLEADLHFIKGSALNLGFDGLAAHCHDGETLVKAGRHAGLNLAAITATYRAELAEFSAGRTGSGDAA